MLSFTLVIPAGSAASCAFMLQVATPPNAIVFGAVQLQLSAMTRAAGPLWSRRRFGRNLRDCLTLIQRLPSFTVITDKG